MPDEPVPIRRTDAMEEFPIPVQQAQDVLLMILNRMGGTLEVLRQQLKGNIYSPETERWEKYGDPLLSEQGIRWVIATVSNYLSVDKLTTNLSGDEVRRMCRDMRLDICDKFYMCSEEFEIKKSDLNNLVDMIDHFVLANLTGSREGTLLGFMKPTYKRVETYKPEEKRKMSWIPFFGNSGD